jgi:hypothetical protein
MDDCAKKYFVEENINFFAELKKSIGNASVGTPDNVCLITNNALTDHHITLPCNHTFNYVPLYHEVKVQKCVKNTSETSKLLINEIKCPYCRKIHNTVLPYCEKLCDKCPPLYGVNTVDIKFKINHCCNYVKYTYTDGTQIHCELTGDNLHYHEEDKQYYCYSHLYIVCKKKQKETKHQEQIAKMKKIKEEQQVLKNVLKEAKAAAKLALKAKPGLINLSGEIVDTINETNEVVLVSTDEVAGCSQTLKTGLFKGDPCNKPIYKKNMCKRHFNLSNAKLLDVVATDNAPDTDATTVTNEPI